MMEVGSDPELTMDGSEGCGGLATVDHQVQTWVSLPQKGKVVDGGHFPSTDLAITRSNLSKKGSFCPSGLNDADPAVNGAITGQASRLCRALKSVYEDPDGTNSTADAASGTIDAAVTGEIVGCVAQGSDGADVAVYEGLSSDLKRSDSDLVKYERRKQVSPSWATIVGASSDEDFSSDTADAVKVFPAVADAMDNAVGQSKVRSVAGNAWNADVAGSGVRKKGPARVWVKCPMKRISPTNGSVSCSGREGLATSVNQTRLAAGPITDINPTSDLRGSDPQGPGSGLFEEKIHPGFSSLGLGDEDFPPIKPLSDLGTSRDASIYVDGSKTKASTEVKASMITVPSRSQPVPLDPSTAKRVFGKGRGDSAAALQSNDFKFSHWRSLFVNRPKSFSPLAFFNPTIVNGKVTINPPAEAVAEGIGLWEESVVGQFFHKRLPLHVVRSFVERLWGKHEIPEISTTDNGLYIFRFKDPEARDWVLENGPWYLVGRPIILRSWKPGMEMLNVHITSLPIWVKFFNIPLEYWTVTSLGYIASTVGIPLHLDTLTENHSRLSFARICVEVDVNCTFPNSALLDLGNGKYSTIRIEYPWVPQKCAHCRIFGHSQVKCKGRKEMDDSGKTTCLDHIDIRLAKGYVDAVDSSPVSNAVNAVDDTVNRATPGKTGNVQITDTKDRLTGNTFECLNQCDDASNLEETVDRTTAVGSDTTIHYVKSSLSGLESLESSKLDLPNVADFSDTSPICETFKHIKRIDELDLLPLSKKKLKKLRKQEHATKTTKSSSSVDTLSPYIVDID